MSTPVCPNADAQDAAKGAAPVVSTVSYSPLYHGLQRWGQPLVRATINGRVPGTFIADTGTQNDVLTDNVVGLLGVTPRPLFRGGQPFLQDGRPAQAADVKLRLGGFNISAPMIVVPQSRVFASVPGLSGILGMNNFGPFAMLFDFRAQTITMIHPGAVTAETISRLGMTDASAVPLALAADGRPYVVVTLSNGSNTVAQKMLVDTGSDASVITHGLALSLGLKSEGQGASSAWTGPITTHASHMTGLSIGSASLYHQAVQYYDDRDISGKATPYILGLDVLSQFRVLLDFPAGKMYLAPLPPSVPPVQVKPAAPAPVVASTPAARP